MYDEHAHIKARSQDVCTAHGRAGLQRSHIASTHCASWQFHVIAPQADTLHVWHAVDLSGLHGMYSMFVCHVQERQDLDAFAIRCTSAISTPWSRGKESPTLYTA